MNEKNENLGDILVKVMEYLNNGKYNELLYILRYVIAFPNDKVAQKDLHILKKKKT